MSYLIKGRNNLHYIENISLKVPILMLVVLDLIFWYFFLPPWPHCCVYIFLFWSIECIYNSEFIVWIQTSEDYTNDSFVSVEAFYRSY